MPYARTIHSFEITNLKSRESDLAEAEQLLMNLGAKPQALIVREVRTTFSGIVDPEGNDFREELPSS